MILVKNQKEHSIETYRVDDGFVKIYRNWTADRLKNHVVLVDRINPGYYLDHGIEKDYVWAKSRPIQGTMASEYKHTDEFAKNIMSFCIENYKKTYPYAHMEWSLNNIIIQDSQIHLIDWDTLGVYPPKYVWESMHKMFYKMFGDRINKLIK
jgi:hypothetical protein